MKWPISWIELKSRMESIKDPHISVRAYEKMAKACQVEDVQIKLLHWFRDLGVSFCFRNNFKLKNQIILQPKWIINGITPHKSIHELLENAPGDTSIKCTDRSAEYEIPRDAEYVLGIMRQFGLSLQIGEDKEFIPMLCQPHPTLNLAAYETGEEVLEFHMVFDYLPNNVLHQLMVAQYSELDLANVWRTGARFQQPGTGLSAVVAMDENTLKFFISSSDTQYVP